MTSISPSPCPRYAYQLVYDPINSTHYLFGGNPGTASASSLRLNDLWTMKVHRAMIEGLGKGSVGLLSFVVFFR